MAAQSTTLVFHYATDTFLLAALYESIHRISSFHMEESFFFLSFFLSFLLFFSLLLLLLLYTYLLTYVAELVMQLPLSVQKGGQVLFKSTAEI